MATTKVNSEFIAVNAISGTIIADGAITSTHLAANSVDSSELVTGSIDTIHIAANQVTATKIVTNGVLTRHISDDQVTADKLANSINTDIATGPAALPKAGGTMTGDLTVQADGAEIFLKSADHTVARIIPRGSSGSDLDKGLLSLFHAGTEDVRIDTGGNSWINSGNNLGIGTTSPSQKLHVEGAGNQFILLNNSSTNDGFYFKAGSGASSIQTNAGSHLMNFFTGGNERFRIDSTGAFGIGGGNYGTDGQILTSTGGSSAPAWEDAPAGGPTFKTFGTSSIMIGDTTTGTIDAANYNTGLGIDVFAALTSGDSNTAVGTFALTANTTASNNTGLGYGTLYATSTGQNNTAVGSGAGLANSTASNNVAVGYQALNTNATKSWNVAVGTQALQNEATSGSNTAVGGLAMMTSNGASNNVAVGKQTAYLLTTGDYNTFVGSNCGFNTTTAEKNTALGYTALYANEGGAYNVAVGSEALNGCTSGSNNIAVGRGAATTTTTGTQNIVIGTGANTGHSGSVGRIVMGGSIDGTSDNRITIGSANGKAELDLDGSDTSWAASSDERLKENITTSTAGLSFINDLRPVTFNWKKKKDIPATLPGYEEGSDKPNLGETYGTVLHGFVAQEVKTVIDNHSEVKNGQAIWKTGDDTVQKLAPAALVPMLVKAIQELEARVKVLEG